MILTCHSYFTKQLSFIQHQIGNSRGGCDGFLNLADLGLEGCGVALYMTGKPGDTPWSQILNNKSQCLPGARNPLIATSLCNGFEDEVAVKRDMCNVGRGQNGSVSIVEVSQRFLEALPAVWHLADIVGVPAHAHWS